MYWWWSKHVKGIVVVNDDGSLGWGIEKCVGVGVGITSGD